jgi:Zn-dependent protease
MLVRNFPTALFVVSVAFIGHELGHRYMARRFGCYARYHLWMQGLMLSILFTILTNGVFVFAAPGAVVIYPTIGLWGETKVLSGKQKGVVSLFGPLVNISLASLFFVLSLLFSPMESLLRFAMQINAWLGLFNLIPFPPLDGFAIFHWDKRAWAVVIGVCSLFLFIL